MNIPTVRNDSEGHGYYGAPRQGRTHQGIDFICRAGDTVRAFASGVVTKLGYPYSDDLEYRYIRVDNGKFQLDYFYVEPFVEVGDTVFAGGVIGLMQDVCARYPDAKAMQNHYHLRAMKGGEVIDPMPILSAL